MNELQSIRQALDEFDKVNDPSTGGWVMAVRHLLPIAEAAQDCVLDGIEYDTVTNEHALALIAALKGVEA